MLNDNSQLLTAAELYQSDSAPKADCVVWWGVATSAYLTFGVHWKEQWLSRTACIHLTWYRDQYPSVLAKQVFRYILPKAFFKKRNTTPLLSCPAVFSLPVLSLCHKPCWVALLWLYRAKSVFALNEQSGPSHRIQGAIHRAHVMVTMSLGTVSCGWSQWAQDGWSLLQGPPGTTWPSAKTLQIPSLHCTWVTLVPRALPAVGSMGSRAEMLPNHPAAAGGPCSQPWLLQHCEQLGRCYP